MRNEDLTSPSTACEACVAVVSAVADDGDPSASARDLCRRAGACRELPSAGPEPAIPAPSVWRWDGRGNQAAGDVGQNAGVATHGRRRLLSYHGNVRAPPQLQLDGSLLGFNAAAGAGAARARAAADAAAAAATALEQASKRTRGSKKRRKRALGAKPKPRLTLAERAGAWAAVLAILAPGGADLAALGDMDPWVKACGAYSLLEAELGFVLPLRSARSVAVVGDPLGIMDVGKCASYHASAADFA